MANKFEYQISQSITGSTFSPLDTFEFSFQGATSTTRHKFFANQNVDIFYSASAGDGSYTRLPSTDALTIPRAFALGTSYNRKNFVFSVPETSAGVKIIITGSVGPNEGTQPAGTLEGGLAPGQGDPELNIDYDDFKLTVEKPKVEFTEDGMLVYASPSQFIKATTDGLQIKGGDLELNKITTDELEIFGDVTVFGDLQASSIPANTDDSVIQSVTASANKAGSNNNYARADHQHQLEFTTLDNIVSDTANKFTHVSASNIDVEDTLTADIIITRQLTSSVAQISGSTNFGSQSSDIHEFTGSVQILGDMDMTSDLFVGTQLSVGSHITASGNISASGDATGHMFGGGFEIRRTDDKRVLQYNNTADVVDYNPAGVSTGGFRFRGDNVTNLMFVDTADDEIQIGGNLKISSHITASGNISASGTIFAQSFQSSDDGILDFNDDVDIDGNITASGNISASGTSHTFGGLVTIRASADNTTLFKIQDVDNENNLSFRIDSNQHSDFHIDRNGVDKIRLNSFHPAQIDNDAYESHGGLVLGSDVDRGDKSGFGLYVSAGPDSGSIYSAEKVFIGVGGATGSNDMLSVGGNITTTSHITASGNISSSGTGSFGKIQIGVPTAHAHHDLDVTGDIGISNDLHLRSGNSIIWSHGDASIKEGQGTAYSLGFNTYDGSTNTEVLLLEGDNGAKFSGNITASGDISSSGTITANAINVNGTNVLVAGGVDISDDTNLVGGTGITLTNDTLSTTDSEIVHDNLSGFVANEHIDHSGVEITAGAGLTGGGDITSTRNIAVGAGTGVTVNANDVAIGQDVATTANVQFNNITSSGDISASGGFKVGGGITGSNSQAKITLDGSVGSQIAYGNQKVTANSSILKFETGGSERVRILNGGNVGIGVTNPGRKLDVAGNIGLDSNILFDGAGTHFLKHESGTAASDRFTFRFSDNEDVLTVAGDGKVGINTTSPSFNLDVIGNAAFKDSVGTSSFASGFSGYGWRINDGGDAGGATGSDGWGLTIDNLTVRNQMKVYELLINQIRASNGSVWISSVGKVDTVTALTAPSYSLTFDTGSSTFGHGFQVGDLIRAQRYQGGASSDVVFRSDLVVTAIGNSGSLTAITASTGNTPPSGGFDYVRIGNISNSSRQGSIYMTSDDDNAPYIDVIDDVTAHEDFNTSSNIKARLGKLDGINDSDFGDLTEGGNNYGLYSENVYLKGGIRASFGAIGGFGITSTAISASDNSFILSSSNMSMKLGSSANSMTLDSGTGIFMSGSGDFRVGNPSADQFRFAGGDLQITASQINLSGSGVGIATPDFELGTDGLDISSQEKKISLGEGKIILSGSSVPIIKLNGGEISSSNFFVSSVGQMTASAGQIGGFVIDDHSLSSDGVEINKAGQTYFISSSKFKVKHTGEMTGSLVSFKGGTIANWTITSNTLSAGNVTLDSSGIINVGDLTGVGDINDVRTGFRVNNNGEVLIKQGGANSNYIRLDNNVLDINTNTATLSGSSVEILTPSFFLGSATNNISSSDDDLSITTKNLTASGSSVEIQSPNFFLGSATSHISGSSTGLIISSSEFRLDSTNLDIDSVAQEIRLNGITLQGGSQPFIDVNDKIRIDTDGTLHKINSVNKNTFTDTTAGFFLAVDNTTPKVNIGDATNKLSFDGTKFEISSSAIKLSGNNVVIDTQNLTASGSNVEIGAPSFLLGSGQQFISGSGGNIEISSSNFHLSQSGDVILAGKITSNEGTIGGFTIDDHSITTTGIEINKAGESTFISSSNFKVKHTGEITGSDVLFDGGQIANFTITENKLSSGNVSLDSTLQSFIVKDSKDRTVVTVGDQPLGAVSSSDENLFVNSGFESGVDGYFTSSTHAENDTLHTLGGHGNTRVISVDVSTVDPSGGSKHYRIRVGGSAKVT